MIFRNKQAAILMAIACRLNKENEKYIVLFKEEEGNIYFTVSSEPELEEMELEGWKPVVHQSRFYVNDLSVLVQENHSGRVYYAKTIDWNKKLVAIQIKDNPYCWVSFGKRADYQLFISEA